MKNNNRILWILIVITGVCFKYSNLFEKIFLCVSIFINLIIVAISYVISKKDKRIDITDIGIQKSSNKFYVSNYLQNNINKYFFIAIIIAIFAFLMMIIAVIIGYGLSYSIYFILYAISYLITMVTEKNIILFILSLNIRCLAFNRDYIFSKFYKITKFTLTVNFIYIIFLFSSVLIGWPLFSVPQILSIKLIGYCLSMIAFAVDDVKSNSVNLNYHQLTGDIFKLGDLIDIFIISITISFSSLLIYKIWLCTLSFNIAATMVFCFFAFCKFLLVIIIQFKSNYPLAINKGSLFLLVIYFIAITLILSVITNTNLSIWFEFAPISLYDYIQIIIFALISFVIIKLCLSISKNVFSQYDF